MLLSRDIDWQMVLKLSVACQVSYYRIKSKAVGGLTKPMMIVV